VEVFVNGKNAGIQAAEPFVYDLCGLVDERKNRLVIEVATALERERGSVKGASPNRNHRRCGAIFVICSPLLWDRYPLKKDLWEDSRSAVFP